MSTFGLIYIYFTAVIQNLVALWIASGFPFPFVHLILCGLINVVARRWAADNEIGTWCIIPFKL